jgi:hypothetical protein
VSQIKKIIIRLQKKPSPRDFTWVELIKILSHFGFHSVSTGKTGGSRRKFMNDDNVIINLHEPHPRKVLKIYQIEQVLEILKKEKLL